MVERQARDLEVPASNSDPGTNLSFEMKPFPETKLKITCNTVFCKMVVQSSEKYLLKSIS